MIREGVMMIKRKKRRRKREGTLVRQEQGIKGRIKGLVFYLPQ